jgi:hypothetical protein
VGLAGERAERNQAKPTGVEYAFANFLPLPCPVWETVSEVQHLLAGDELFQGSNPPLLKRRRPGPQHPNYGISAEICPIIVHRVVEQKEPLRTVAAACGVSHETIRRIVLQVQKQQRQEGA